MCIKDKKYYLRPTGYLPKSQVYKVKIDNKAIEINDSFFSWIELITREKKITRKEHDNYISNYMKKSIINFVLIEKNLHKCGAINTLIAFTTP